ncbi:MAG TPA: N-acetyl-alpha-D-glucosaminyl L-malate synthase BshA [Polyangia bacterium]
MTTSSAGRPLRVGIVCYPTFGGSGVVATEIGLSLAQRGCRVHVLSSAPPSRLDHLVENVWFHEVGKPSYPLLEESSYTLALASKIVEVTRYEGLDVLHVHYAVPHATSAYLARQILGPEAPRIVTTLHGTDITLVGNDPSFLPITSFSITHSDGITAPSAYLQRATYQNLDVPPSLPIEVIPNFVDTARFAPNPQRQLGQLRGLLGPAAEPNAAGEPPAVVVHVSNFRAVKRVDDVVRIFAEIHKARHSILVLIGDGPERSRVEALARQLGIHGAVVFFGKMQSFVELLQVSDVFLMPSASESFGLAALEALSCGVPVVASNIGGLPEVVPDGEVGFLAPVGDVEAMAGHALRILDDPALKARLSAAARASVIANYQLDPAIDRYQAHYERVLAAPPRSP